MIKNKEDIRPDVLKKEFDNLMRLINQNKTSIFDLQKKILKLEEEIKKLKETQNG
jgi:hypothetical protein